MPLIFKCCYRFKTIIQKQVIVGASSKAGSPCNLCFTLIYALRRLCILWVLPHFMSPNWKGPFDAFTLTYQIAYVNSRDIHECHHVRSRRPLFPPPHTKCYYKNITFPSVRVMRDISGNYCRYLLAFTDSPEVEFSKRQEVKASNEGKGYHFRLLADVCGILCYRTGKSFRGVIFNWTIYNCLKVLKQNNLRLMGAFYERKIKLNTLILYVTFSLNKHWKCDIYSYSVCVWIKFNPQNMSNF